MEAIVLVPLKDRVYELFNGLEPDSVVTYAQLAQVMNCDPQKERHLLRVPVYQACKRLERDNQRTIENVQNVGYRVVHAREHGTLAGKHLERAHRQVRRGARRLAATRRDELTREDRQRLDDQASRMDSVSDVMRRARKGY